MNNSMRYAGNSKSSTQAPSGSCRYDSGISGIAFEGLLDLRRLPNNIEDAHTRGNPHVSICTRVLNYLYRARIVDPVAHLILIQCPVRDRRREVVKASVKNREIHYKV